MAESQEPIESLVKKESEPQRDPIASRSTSAIILVCVVLLMLCTLWALYDEGFGQRPWRPMQQEFVRRYTAYLKSIRKNAGASEADIKATPEYQELADAAQASLDKVKDQVSDIDKQVAGIQARLDAVTEPFQNQRGRLVVITWKEEIAPNKFWKDRYERQRRDKLAEVVSVDLPDASTGKVSRQKMNFQQLEDSFNGLRDEKAKALGQKADLLKEPTDLAKKRDDYLKNHVAVLPQKNIDDLIRKNQNSFDYTILGHQINVNEYQIVDRCEICHLGTREPLTIKASDVAPNGPGKRPDDWARAFVSHPRKELLQIHNPEKFGCSACHGGNGRATTSVVKAHGLNPFWLHPLFHKENTEAGCQMCHANDRVTQGADTLNLGKDLFYQRGCVGCHRMEAFDREADALSNARQQISQLQDQIAANERQAKLDTDNSANVEGDEVQKLLAHADSLRVQNSQLAARIDELNLQTRYLQQDQKKVGPNLKDVRLKLRKEWIPRWLEDPQAFRPGTKMPTFWRFHVDEDGPDDLKAVAAYLWQNGFDGKVPTQAQGDKNHGKELFESRGCLACHSIGEEDQKIGGAFAANLTRVGEKANYDYIVRWIYNPRERYAPYCPKEHRDLTPEDYAKHNQPYLFDTELHSTCPNDGAELQVQNMTVMPNLRLSEQDARDVATYLFSLSAPPTGEDVSYMDDPKLADEGKAEIKQYGCAGCHEIKGFEEEQRIGKELTTEGATPLERLDFALLTQDAEYGREPKGADGQPLVQHKGEKDKEWYDHRGFFEHKLSDPSIYDTGKSKYLEPKDRLRMPKPYLTESWRTGLTTLLLGSEGAEGANVPASLFYNPQDSRRQDIQNGWWVIKKYNCMGCHVLQPGQQISAYNNSTEPTMVIGSVLSSLSFYSGQREFLPPMLTSEGARVDPDWLMKFLKDPSLMQPGEKPMMPSSSSAPSSSSPASSASPSAAASPGAKPAAATANDQSNGKLLPQWGLNRNGVRPYIQVHMPTFNFSPNELRTLVKFFMAVSSQNDPYIKEPMEPLTDQERQIARDIFTSGTPCLKCHVTGDPVHDAKATAPNFLLASQRLKPDWIMRWLPKPSDISPGVAMPDGMFVKNGDRWVVGAPNAPADVVNYPKDHARLVTRYMFMITPEEQKRLMSASPAPAKPAAAPATTTTTGRNNQQSNGRQQLSRNRNGASDRRSHHRLHHARYG
ncbi:MAG TPA: c-type cytochrome [Pyrinomonadaceae bacterium]|nr:c-type cytochrome [Pyrinomonadaceae bacterium]